MINMNKINDETEKSLFAINFVQNILHIHHKFFKDIFQYNQFSFSMEINY